ncbi:ATG13-like protein, partial [Mya arenaria]
MTSKTSFQDKKDFDKFTKFFIYKSVQIIVQSRLGEKIKSRSKPFSSGADWFNLAITDNNDVQNEAKKVLSNQTSTLGQTVIVEISLRTAEGDTMVLEIWHISLDANLSDAGAKMSQTGYYRMGIALKSLLNVTRVTPAYKLSRRQSSSDYVICYRIYLGEPHFFILGDDHQKSKVGAVPTPYGTISINLYYRTKLLISPQNTSKDTLFEVKDDHFKQECSPVRTTTPKPCALGYKSSSTSDSDTGGGHSEESCTTTFSTSPCDAPRSLESPAPHHQSQPIKIQIKPTSPPADTFLDFRTQSAPEKQSTYQDCHRVGAFARIAVDKQAESSDDVPFLSLLQQVNNERGDKTDKVDGKALDSSKGTSSTKTDSSRADTTSESALSESKTSTCSLHSVPDDFVMVEDCQSAPALTLSEEEHIIPETLEQLTNQIDTFEVHMKDFDKFVSELTDDTF